jgi:hypothetical protein
MKFIKTARVVSAMAVLASASTVFAQTTTAPTTATELAQSINMSDAQSAGLVIVGLLVGVGVVLWGARLVESKFRPKI